MAKCNLVEIKPMLVSSGQGFMRLEVTYGFSKGMCCAFQPCEVVQFASCTESCVCSRLGAHPGTSAHFIRHHPQANLLENAAEFKCG